jgi:hypothetical protein
MVTAEIVLEQPATAVTAITATSAHHFMPVLMDASLTRQACAIDPFLPDGPASGAHQAGFG